MALLSNPYPQWIDSNDETLIGAQLNFYITGTLTRKDTYSNAALTTANANPVICDAAGGAASIWLAEDVAYRLRIIRADGSLYKDLDPISSVSSGDPFTAWSSTATYSIPDVVIGSDDNYYRSIVDNNLGNDPISSASSWSKVDFNTYWNTNQTYAVNDIVIGTDGQLYRSTIAANAANDPTTDGENWAPAVERPSNTDYSYRNFGGFN